MKTNIKRYRKAKKRSADDEQQEETLTSAALVSHDDVLIDILVRLPIRSLLRSKCVSKHWRSLISDHRFSLLRNPNPNPPCGLFLHRFRNVNAPTLEYDFVPFDRENLVKPPFKTLNFNGNESKSGIMILHSSNGLMLCHSLHEDLCRISKEIVYNAMYYVYNPTINQVVTLPKLWLLRRPRGLTLAFNPLKSPHYRVVCVHGSASGVCHLLYTIRTYSSETGSWKMSGIRFYNQIDTEFMGGVYWNDAVHWINKKGFVFYLKMDEDRLDQIATPITRDDWNFKRHCYPLVESRDCLLFMDIFPPSSRKFDVYEMNRDYSGWLVKYHVDLDEVITHMDLTLFLRPHPFVLHCLVVGDREQDSFVVLEVPGKAIRYNIVLKTYQELCDLDLCQCLSFSVADDGFSKVGRWPGSFLFFESLSYV